MSVRTCATHQGNPFVPAVIRARDSGLRPSVKRLMDMIDTEHPSWPSVADTLREMQTSGVELDEVAFEIAVKVGRRRWERRSEVLPASQATAEKLTLAVASGAIVYYVRRGQLIKIGTTIDPLDRFKALLPDEILAFEPGSYDLENRRHREFAHLRAYREHFAIAPELTDHAARIRALYGDPDPAWPTSATIRSRLQETLPEVRSLETMTAAEAVERLGIKQTTLRGWVHRRKIQPVGRDYRNHMLFYAEHLTILRDGYRVLSHQVA